MLCCGPTQNDRNVIPDAVTELGEGWPGTAQARLVQEALRDAEKFRCGFDADMSFGVGSRRRSACYIVDKIGAGGVKE